MRKDVIFASAIARYNEIKLLKKEQLLRVTSAADVGEALKMLYDHGYARAATNDIDEVISAQIEALNRYVVEECPDNNLLQIILNPFLYGNAKYYYKTGAEVEAASGEVYVVEGDEQIKAAFQNRSYGELPKAMRECVQRLEALKADGKLSGRVIDNEFNTAMFSASLACAKKSLRYELVRFVRAQIDLNNLVTFIRCRRLGRDFDFCSEMLIAGGKIDIEELAAAYLLSDADAVDSLARGEHAATLEAMMAGKVNLDLGIDAVLISQSARNEIKYTTLSPFLAYYYKQLTEYRVVRMVLMLIKNNMRGEIDKRIRGLYD